MAKRDDETLKEYWQRQYRRVMRSPNLSTADCIKIADEMVSRAANT